MEVVRLKVTPLCSQKLVKEQNRTRALTSLTLFFILKDKNKTG
jgi:hypothetical protein